MGEQKPVSAHGAQVLRGSMVRCGGGTGWVPALSIAVGHHGGVQEREGARGSCQGWAAPPQLAVCVLSSDPRGKR